MMTSEIEKEDRGDCFEANFHAMMDLFSKSKDAFLVHGQVIGSAGTDVEGKVFWHAWIELNEFVLDFSNGRRICIKKEELLKKERIVAGSERRYTFLEACKNILKHEHYGEWN